MDWDKAYNKAIIEFGYKPEDFKKQMSEIGAPYSPENDEYYAKGGQLNDTLVVKPSYKYKNSANKWLEDNDKNSTRYKLAVLLLSGEKNPDEILGIENADRYARLLRNLEKVGGESKHEMAWRTQNYTIAQAEGWAKEKLNEVFSIKSSKMARGGATSRYNTGRSWHMDRARHNKSEKWEVPMNNRKLKDGGRVKSYPDLSSVSGDSTIN